VQRQSPAIACRDRSAYRAWSGAILALTRDRVDLHERIIDFRVPDETETKKRKVAQPINADLLAILSAAKTTAASDCVIARAGDVVGSIKHGFASACDRAGLTDVTPPYPASYRDHLDVVSRGADLGGGDVCRHDGETDRRHLRACHRWIEAAGGSGAGTAGSVTNIQNRISS
jgi:hypothetical protein